MEKTMDDICFELSDAINVHPKNIDVVSNFKEIIVMIIVPPGTDPKPIFDAVFDYLRALPFSKREVEVRTA